MPEPPISTKAEAKFLEQQAPTADPAPALTPGGDLQAAVDRDVEAKRQRRIAFIQNRLAGSSYRMRRDHTQAITR